MIPRCDTSCPRWLLPPPARPRAGRGNSRSRDQHHPKRVEGPRLPARLQPQPDRRRTASSSAAGSAPRRHRVKVVVHGPAGGGSAPTTTRDGAFGLRWAAQRTGIYEVRAYGVHDRRVRGVARASARQLTVYRHAAASYYGPGLYGNGVACGGTLQPGTLGVANKTLPCGTKVSSATTAARHRPGRRPRPLRRRPRLRPDRGDQGAAALPRRRHRARRSR